MLDLARAQGEDLLRLKEVTPYGSFQAVVARTGLSPFMSKQYMRVAREWADKVAMATFCDDSIRAFLDRKEKKPTAPAFTKVDAEYALKVAALADRGVGGERDAALSWVVDAVRGEDFSCSQIQTAIRFY
jgi:hypothetical protein